MLTPKTNPVLIGHDAPFSALLDDFKAGKLAHGWIISGPKGIGKATFAYHFARALLSGKTHPAADHPVFLRMASGSHTDFLVVEPAFDAKKEEYARDITVGQAREIAQFLSLTPGEGQWRVVIIDAVDALNTNGANAILKILEEPPPQAVLLLVSHNPGRLLPTIRSRCRNLKLKALDKQQFHDVISHISPDVSEDDRNALGELSHYLPGIALSLNEQGAISLYKQLLDLLKNAPSLDTARIHAFADSMTAGKQHANWTLFTHMTLSLLERVTLAASGTRIEAISDNESKSLARIQALHPAYTWAAKWQQVADQFLLAERLHLDYKQLIIVFFHSLMSDEEFKIGTAV